jgi:alpha-beta hydrolase superfamily lysophospholipase
MVPPRATFDRDLADHRTGLGSAAVHSEGSITAADGVEVFHQRWTIDAPTGTVVIAHGASEHSGRYARFAEALNAAGWDAVALDHRGHGRTRESTGVGRLGPAGGQGLLDDLGALIADVGASGRPVVLFGHSMGSMISQGYAASGAAGLAGYVLSGPIGVVEGSNDLLDGLRQVAGSGMADEPLDALGAYNEPFEPARTPFDWLSRDPAEVDAYLADPWCGDGNPLTYGFFVGLLEVAIAGVDPAAIAATPRIPVLLVAGSMDPAGGMTTQVEALAARLREGGLDTTAIYYTDARHEVLNETNRDEVTADVVAWLRRVAP